MEILYILLDVSIWLIGMLLPKNKEKQILFKQVFYAYLFG